MSLTILATKLFTPPNRPNWVLRPRLLARLNASLRSGSKLTLVSAPAGFGKTTLVSEWLAGLRAAQPPVQVAWLSLDPGDNDLAVFLHYLVAALQTCLPGAGAVTRGLLEQAHLPPLEALLLPLINDLAQLRSPLVLVLDDYHAIQLPAIHEGLALLIERQPPLMHIVITTRQDPLLPLARWRARGLLTEIRLKELRFSLAETGEFLNNTMGFQLHEADVATLESRTEGWIAGLQLAAVSMMQAGEGEPGDTSGSPAGLVESITGTNRYVMDYLVDEVLSRQPEEIQRFLLETSVLARFNAALCQAVLSDELPAAPAADVAATLRYLEQVNLFLIPLDNQREWYRYHHLFAELLQHRLAAGGRERAGALRQRASLWCAGQDLPEEAIGYAQAAGDWALSARHIARFVPQVIQRGQQVTALRWLKTLPDEIVRTDPLLCRLNGYLLTVTGKLDLGQEYLNQALQMPAASSRSAGAESTEHLGCTLAIASYNACFRGDFEEEIEQAQRALALLPAGQPWERGIASISLGIGLCHTYDPHGCEAAMREAYQAGRRSGTPRTCVIALAYLGRMSVLRLDFAQAEAYFEEAAGLEIDGRRYAPYDMALFDLAQLMYEQNELERARAYVERGFEANRFSGSPEMRAYGLRLAARMAQLRGDSAQGWELLEQALQMSKTFNLSPLTLSLNGAMLVQMALADGRPLEAERGAALTGSPQGLYSFNFLPDLARVPLRLQQGQRGEALAELEKGLWRAQQPGWEYPRLQVRALQSLAESDPLRAGACLREALALAAPVRAVRSIVDLGAPMQARLQALRPQLRPDEQAFAGYLLRAFDSPPCPPGEAHLPAEAGGRQSIHKLNEPEAKPAQQALIEPLSERELEVLKLLAESLSSVEIAARLYLSPNTLKAHTQNIYAKLDVHSRVQAINKARELGLF